MAIGHIKTVSVVDGQVTAYVTTGSGTGVTVTIMPQGSLDFQPLAGDAVQFHRSGQEIVVTGVFSEDNQAGPGEAVLFSRTSPGVIAATVHVKATGAIEVKPGTGQVAGVGEGSDFVAMSTKTDQKIQAILDAINGAAVGSADGGAAFKANIVAALNVSLPAIGPVASSNLKAD